MIIQELLARADDVRYERKFHLDGVSMDLVLAKIQSHPAIFREAYPERKINNIYFDTLRKKNYADSLDGAYERIKVRVRWYQETLGPVEKPILEFKVKTNYLTSKVLLPLKPFVMDQRITSRLLHEAFEQLDLSQRIKHYLKTMNIVLLNGYNRRYYISADKRYRITVDDALQYNKLFERHNHFLSKMSSDQKIVMELKYNMTDEQQVNRITRHFPFRVDKYSKYLTGVHCNVY